MNLTPIEWTDFSANPLKFRDKAGKVGWGCVHASPGCVHCYAETLAKRYGRGGPFNVQAMAGLTPFLDEAELHKMLTAEVIAKTPVSGGKCFVGDLTDIFGPWVPDELLDRLFAVFALRPDVTWQLLTKRAERMRVYLSSPGVRERVSVVAAELCGDRAPEMVVRFWPLLNVWLGVSVEDQQRAAERIPHLLQSPAAVRFISAEPLIGPLAIRNHLISGGDPGRCENCGRGHGFTRCPNYGSIAPTDSRSPQCDAFKRKNFDIDWVIVGGESGPSARNCSIDWVRSIVQQCQAAAAPVFVKQLGSAPIDWSKAKPTGNFRTNQDTGKRQFEIVQPALKSRKGSDMDEWPADLRVREFPRSAVSA